MALPVFTVRASAPEDRSQPRRRRNDQRNNNTGGGGIRKEKTQGGRSKTPRCLWLPSELVPLYIHDVGKRHPRVCRVHVYPDDFVVRRSNRTTCKALYTGLSQLMTALETGTERHLLFAPRIRSRAIDPLLWWWSVSDDVSLVDWIVEALRSLKDNKVEHVTVQPPFGMPWRLLSFG